MTLRSHRVSKELRRILTGLSSLQQAHGKRKYDHGFQPQFHAQGPDQQERDAEDEDFERHGCELDTFP